MAGRQRFKSAQRHQFIKAVDRGNALDRGGLGMSSRKFVWDPEHWRFRAEEARTVADHHSAALEPPLAYNAVPYNTDAQLDHDELRRYSDQMTHEEARTIMRHIANDYDRLAKLAEAQLAAQERGSTDD